jgi:FtsP/CotA-like multicopper oxidase with cupredoxin domain
VRTSLTALVAVLLTSGATARDLPVAVPNANRDAAGSATDDGITIDLYARRVLWHPNGDSLPGRYTEAFAEGRKAPTVPGPLVRVRAGTQVLFRVSNPELTDTLRFVLPPPLMGGRDTLMVAPGATGELRVTLSQPGNFYYRAWTSDVQSEAFGMKGLLGGAVVVDSATAVPRDDRVLVVNWLVDSLTPDGKAPNYNRMLFAINGRSWPHTERLAATVGDSIRWRIINLNVDVHPMHLHGVYFRVDEFFGPPAAIAAGGPNGRMAVTERMGAFTTMSMTWVPERAGNWLFHCHFAFHLLPTAVLERGEPAALEPPKGDHGPHANHALTGMSGIVMGIHVAPRPGAAFTDADPPRRRLRLVAFADPGYPDSLPSMRFRLEEARHGTAAITTHARPGFSPTINLTRGEPVSITVVNTTREATAVHWHGIELESYYDGAAGFGGQGTRISPIIAPRDSFEARFTPPRSGTFIYHSHVNEVRQHAAGMLGALVVRDAGVPPANDYTFLLKASRADPLAGIPLEVNGMSDPDTVVIPVGQPTRFRLMNLTVFHPNTRFILTARRDSANALPADSLEVRWIPVAKDGADLPDARRLARAARQIISMGETYDFVYTPTAAGDLRLEMRAGSAGLLVARVPIRAR